jgi:dGTPase
MSYLENLHLLEDQVLASYAQRSQESKGRFYSEPEHEYRMAYQRDRDRIIHSTAFRRLQYKTQVFVNHEGDYYRTRITHTLEVAKIAQTIARVLKLNQDLSESIALAHDLGHTPFGHCGEKVLNDLMKKDGGFEHNAQSYRLVTELEDPYPDFRGLNLTYEVLEGIDKHRTRYDRSLKNVGTQYTLEAQLVDLADEIAYTAHDIDDGITSGLLTLEDLKEVKLCQCFLDEINKKYNHLESSKVKHIIVRKIIDYLVTDLVTITLDRIVRFKIKTVDNVRNFHEELVTFSSKAKQQHHDLKKFLSQKMYKHHRVVRIETKSIKVIQELFKIYDSRPEVLPENTFSKIQKQKTSSKKRIICDYIAGMTDRFAIEEYEKLTIPSIRV